MQHSTPKQTVTFSHQVSEFTYQDHNPIVVEQPIYYEEVQEDIV